MLAGLLSDLPDLVEAGPRWQTQCAVQPLSIDVVDLRPQAVSFDTDNCRQILEGVRQWQVACLTPVIRFLGHFRSDHAGPWCGGPFPSSLAYTKKQDELLLAMSWLQTSEGQCFAVLAVSKEEPTGE